MKKEQISTLYVFMAALLFSIGGLCVKVIPWSGITINGVRSLISVLMLSVYFKVTGRKLTVNKSVLVGAVSMAGVTTFFCLANKLTTAANTIILQFTAPVFVILFSWLLFKERPKKLDLAACGVVFVGILFFFVDSLSAGNLLGNAVAILSGVCYAGVFMMNTSPDADSMSSIFLGQAVCAVTQAPFIFAETQFPTTGILAVLVLGVFQLALAYILMAKGLEHTPAVAASLTTAIEPILNPILVAIFYKEQISSLSFVGAAIVFLGIISYNGLKLVWSAPKDGEQTE
ncbi:MAG: EamA family transporter [Lachnospiraceae bacterium]|nr:EamA family transporter [Lachnospiraceae bacterium]